MALHWFTFLLLSIAFILNSGCDSNKRTSSSGSRTPPYSFCMMSRSGEIFKDITLHWGDLHESFGIGIPNSLATMSFFEDPIPEKARVSWTTVDGESGEAEADVPQPSRERLKEKVTFCFVILPDRTLKVGAYTHKEYFKEGKAFVLARNGGPTYAVKTKNASGNKLKHVQVFFGPYLVNGSKYEEIEAHDNYGNWGNPSVDIPYPVTDTARVEWTTPDGVQHKQELDLKLHRPDDLNGVYIVFIIDQHDKAHVRFLLWDERKTWQHKDLLEDNPAGP